MGRALAAAVIAALVLPGFALAEATMVTRDLPVNGARTLASAQAPERFNVLGLHWRGSGKVFFRVRGARGWSRWHEADAEPKDLPDRGSPEARRSRGWRIGNPWWTDTAERVQVRTRGQVSRVRGHFVWSPEEPTEGRALQMAGQPKIILRPAWKANERIRRDDPDYAPVLTTTVVHHTAGAAGYSCSCTARPPRARTTSR